MTRHVSEEREKLAAKLRVTTEQMAHRCSVDQVLWNMHSNACLEAADLLLSTSSAERGMREAAVALSKEVDRMWNDPHRFNPPAWESHAKAICSAQQDLSAALAATSYGKASTDRLQSKEVLLVSARIPLRCLACGNVVMTPRQEEEARAAHIARSACTECDPHGERHEQFYFTRDGRLLSYGQWMEHLEMPGASSATKAAVDLLEGNPEGSYGALVAGALLESRDLLSGMVGLVDLLLNRADLPVEVRNVLRSNHRIVDARAALNQACPA